MSDIFHEVDEDVRRDKAENLWRRYQTPIYVVAFLIVAATGAWSYYQDKRQKEAEGANARFEAAAALINEGKVAEGAAAFDALAKDGPKGYAALARIRAAEARTFPRRNGTASTPSPMTITTRPSAFSMC